MVSLTTGWRLQDFAPGEGVTRGAHTTDHDARDWFSVEVPGDVHRTLIAAGRIPDPFYDRNETDCGWMEEREWWYRLHFTTSEPELGSDERLLLVFRGLDTLATVYLNDEQIGEHHNMFRPASFDVSRRFRHGAPNILAIRFDPPLSRVPTDTAGYDPRGYIRKGQYAFGWDWGPRLPTIGIWQPVELHRQRVAVLASVHFTTLDVAPNAERAAVAVRVEVDRFADDVPLTVRARLSLQLEDTIARASVSLDPDAHGTVYLTVEQPRLWWTHELGDPTLYQLTVTLLAGDNVVDEDVRRVGIRTLSLDQSPDPAEPGTRFFRFVLNGVPMFVKGADWIPCDSFVGAIGPESYTSLLEAARDAHMTMLRVWGGGIYEHDEFYRECDRLGIMVWQDFMFSKPVNTEDDVDYQAEVDAEARHQVRRLRSHPCLALWCGNNEIQWGHEKRNWESAVLPPFGARYFDVVLPRAVAELDGVTPYWPSSPYGGNDHNSMEEGNRHNWDVWHGNFSRRFGERPRVDQGPEGVSYLRYAEDRGRFISEFGMHAAPVIETLRRVIPQNQLYHHSPSMDWHNKDNPKNKGDNLMLTTTGLPEGLEQYIAFSQIAQAEGLKFGIEHFRQRKPHCSGALVWQLNDCWPVLSWSVLDYYGFPKASYFYVGRAFAPVLASFRSVVEGGLELWLTNDTRAAVSDEPVVRVVSFRGGVLFEESLPGVHLQAGESRRVKTWSSNELQPGVDRCVTVRSVRGAFPKNRHFFTQVKDLSRQPTAPAMTIRQVDAHRLGVTLAAPADCFVYFAHVATSWETTRYSDNYVDLEPDEARELIVTDPAHALVPGDITLGWG